MSCLSLSSALINPNSELGTQSINTCVLNKAMYLHGTLPYTFSHFKKQREHKEKRLNSLNWEKKIMLHISLMVPGARVSLIMGKSVA